MIGKMPTIPGALIGYLPKSGRPVYVQAGGAPGEGEPRSIEDREERVKEIDARLAELDAEFDNVPMPDEARDEWNRLNGERDNLAAAITELRKRRERMQQLAARPGATEGAREIGAPSFVPTHGDEIYDLNRIRTASRSDDEHKLRLRDNAKRAIERAAFPVTSGQRAKVAEHVEQLLENVDDRSGSFAKRILATGNPIYDRAFGKAVMQGMHTLSGDELRAMSVGGGSPTGSEGGLAVPFQLDPTVILTSDGTVSSLRQISRVETITSKTWQGITSAGITVSRSGEGDQADDDSFTISQPEVTPTRVIANVPFSVEIDQDWPQLRNEIARLLADAKAREEDAAFVTGDGTGDNPFGVVATLDESSEVQADSDALALADLDTLESELGPRFRGRASFLANKKIYQEIRSLARQGAAFAGDRWVNLTADTPAMLDGYAAYEASEMTDDFATADGRYLLFGDFSQFLIVDRLGMNVEVMQHVVGANQRWTGQRALVAMWRNGSKVLVDNAFRVLVPGTS